MYKYLAETIKGVIGVQILLEERKTILQPLINFVQQKVDRGENVNLNFICTHNSRRSHLAQVWAQVASAFFGVPNVHCYSGGTEETAVFPAVVKTLTNQGFIVFKVAETENPVYAIKYGDDAMPIVGFSKKYDSPFNPASAFAAVMTCEQADGECPFITGAEKRIAIPYEDPKISDGSPEQAQVYTERSMQVAHEMCYVFSKISLANATKTKVS